VNDPATGWRPGPGLVIAIVAVALLLGDQVLTAATGPEPTTLVVYNRTTSPISFETGDARKVLIHASPCSTVAFDVIDHEWRLRSGAQEARIDEVPIDVTGLIPPYPDAAGASRWEIVISPDRMDGGLVYPNRPTPPPCDGPPRAPVHLAGTTSATLGPYRLAGGYRVDLTVAVPGETGCAFAASAHGTEGLKTIVADRVAYEPIAIAGASTGFTPDTYTIEVYSSCGAWDIQLTPD
jgi:hypothetical protein